MQFPQLINAATKMWLLFMVLFMILMYSQSPMLTETTTECSGELIHLLSCLKCWQNLNILFKFVLISLYGKFILISDFKRCADFTGQDSSVTEKLTKGRANRIKFPESRFFSSLQCTDLLLGLCILSREYCGHFLCGKRWQHEDDGSSVSSAEVKTAWSHVCTISHTSSWHSV